MQEKIKGTGVAIVTPFNKQGAVDYSSLEKIVDHIIVNKVDFVVGLGTTSEAATLTEHEKDNVMSCVVKTVSGRVPVVMGIGGNNTQHVIDTINNTNFDDISSILTVAPYYNKPNQRGMLAHFGAIAKASPVPLILYNVPSRTSSNISAMTVLKLADDHENIVAVKEASGDLNQITEILRKRPHGFSVLSGDDALTLPMMALGADGVISVIANAFPFSFSQMVRLMANKQFDKALAIHYSLTDIIEQLFKDGNPGGVKAALSIMKLCENQLRLPLVTVDDAVHNELKRLVENYQQPK